MTSDQAGRLGSGTVMGIHILNPAPGAQFQYIVPPGTLIRIQGVYFELIADATILNRNMGYYLNDGVNQMVQLYHVFDIAAGITALMNVISGSMVEMGSCYPTNLALPLNGTTYLSPGMIIGSAVINMQAGDQIGEPTLLVERWAIE